LENMKIAAADRQAVFRDDCRRCHFEPVVGKRGEELYQAACGICHETPHRATMVPDLATLPEQSLRQVDYWRFWIVQGKPDSLMPAFGRQDGGPLSEHQISHLAQYLTRRFARENGAQVGVGREKLSGVNWRRTKHSGE
jgi:cytochrome c553